MPPSRENPAPSVQKRYAVNRRFIDTKGHTSEPPKNQTTNPKLPLRLSATSGNATNSAVKFVKLGVGLGLVELNQLASDPMLFSLTSTDQLPIKAQ